MDRTKFAHLPLGDRIFQTAIYAVGAIVFVLVLYPILFVLSASISDPSLVMTGKLWLWPRGVTLEGFRLLLSEGRIWTGYRNTIAYTVVGMAISMFVTIPAAYALSRQDFKVRRPMMIFFLITLYFSGGLIPTYITITKTLGLDNSFWVMVIPFCLNVYNMIIMRTFFENSVPKELWEAAQMDGCSHTRYLFRVMLPLSRAVLSVVMLYYIVGKWNEYFMALIYLRDEKLVSLQIVLRDILIMNQNITTTTDAGTTAALRRATLIKYTSIVAGTLPMMVLYPLLQKYFEKGVMIGAVKG